MVYQIIFFFGFEVFNIMIEFSILALVCNLTSSTRNYSDLAQLKRGGEDLRPFL